MRCAAVHLAGQGIELRQLGERVFAFMARVDRAHDAERAHRLAVGAGKPAAGVLQPDFLAVAAAPERVLHLIDNPAAGVVLSGPGDGVEAALPFFGFDVLREAASAGDVGGLGRCRAAQAALPLQTRASVSSRHS